MTELGSTMRVFWAAPHILAFYDGRIPGVRAWSEAPNWLDDGAFTLGLASYAIIDGGEALVYDTHMSLAHAALIRRAVEAAGAHSIRVVLSHWHTDHVAGNAIFADCPIIANAETARLLEEHREELARRDPPIEPLVMPTQLFEGSLALSVGQIQVRLLQFEIHSADATVILLPDRRLLLAGDTLEDSVTYVGEPERLAAHLIELDRLATLPIVHILPSHGAPDIIEGGGYGKELILATKLYTERLLSCRDDAALAALDLPTFAADLFAEGWLRYEPAYERVHRQNVECVLGLRAPSEHPLSQADVALQIFGSAHGIELDTHPEVHEPKPPDFT
jgi:glyoxylase-like metal-dependent hydrolase (beta-lactamase superfamily II)